MLRRGVLEVKKISLFAASICLIVLNGSIGLLVVFTPLACAVNIFLRPTDQIDFIVFQVESFIDAISYLLDELLWCLVKHGGKHGQVAQQVVSDLRFQIVLLL